MRLFKCHNCGQLLHFENTHCERCAHRLGYLPERNTLSAVEPERDSWRARAAPERRYRFCANAEYQACNWLIEADEADVYCFACRHNRTIPDLTQVENLLSWRKIEWAKHRLFYSLLRLSLPTEIRDDSAQRLTFDFLAEQPIRSGAKVMTGHDNGLITIALAEANDAEREKRRAAMSEPYRTLLGHFRHEVGHYYWDRIVRDGGHGTLNACRAVFGDHTDDYEAALQRHYREGVPKNWQENYVSAYATTHAWEDWAETWAHYLHIVDTLEMAGSLGVRTDPKLDQSGALKGAVDFDPYAVADAQELVNAWLRLTFALNGMNRCMGQADVYPFILFPAVIQKLQFVHRAIHDQRL